MISREEARVKIRQIIDNNNPIKTGEKLPIRLDQTFNVYRIPIEYLVPNILNDRIAWKIREFEAENGRHLRFDSESDIDLVRQFILDEHPKENETTLKDLALKGQQVHGVITKDGIIIDGNRRATLLYKLFKGECSKYNKVYENFRHFECIILNEDISREEIIALETSIQIGEDIKVKYNPINMYIKIDNLERAGYSEEQIKQQTNYELTKIRNMKEAFELMNNYLEFIEKPKHFTLLDNLEDHFLNAKTIFKKLDEKTYDANWEYTDNDVSNFKEVAFNYMRSKFEGKKFRDVLLGKPNKTDGMFIDKDTWEKFYEHHNQILSNATLNNEEDWKEISKKFGDNLKRSAKSLEEKLEEKDISGMIKSINSKVQILKLKTLNLDEISEEDLHIIHSVEKTLYEIRREFKNVGDN